MEKTAAGPFPFKEMVSGRRPDTRVRVTRITEALYVYYAEPSNPADVRGATPPGSPSDRQAVIRSPEPKHAGRTDSTAD
jgi:hypothetical protein